MRVMQIRPSEQVRVDQERLGTLYAQLGPAGAEDVVCRALEELALRMSHCDALYGEQNWPDLRKNIRSLVAIADQIGMQMLSRVAADVVQCIDQQNAVGLAATLSRLLRIGERSLVAIWDVRDLDR